MVPEASTKIERKQLLCRDRQFGE